jgi:hypothetical protein
MNKMANQNKTKKTISLLEQKRKDLVQLLTKGVFNRSDHFHYYFVKWRSETEDALLRIFGEDSRELKKFELAAQLAPVRGSSVILSEHRRKTMLRAAAELEAILSSIKEYGIPEKQEGAIPPKAFIAHEGETRALTILKEFLEALGIQYFIAESKASDGRSIEKQVDWTQSEADFAVCLATKGKAINKKTGKHYMAPNIIDELGRARQVFGNKIILLVQKGVEVHTNVGEIVHETFTTTNMERAFIKITKELRNWGFIRVGKPKE